MTTYDWLQLLIYVFLILVFTPLLGHYFAKVFTGGKTFIHPLFFWFEKLCYKMFGINPNEEMSWVKYAKTLLIFNLLGFFAVFALMLLQKYLPLNPENLPGTSLSLAFNTAISFATNTDWQAYSGETTLSYLTQMLGLTVQNFLSAAIGFAVIIALIRSFTLKNSNSIGNFWVDITRSVTYVLLPFSILLSVVLVSQGVIQNFSSYKEVETLENVKQILPMGPAASQVAIKQLGSNGGGFFGVNSTHPFENPTPLSNFLEMLSIVLIPSAIVYAFGIMVGSISHGRLLFCVMMTFWIFSLSISYSAEHFANQALDVSPVLEGQETRFGPFNSILWTISTTATSNGSVNSMLSSLPPLAGGMALLDILIGEIAFGGIGTGLAMLIIFAILTVFLCGLMVGRTPEYLGKKIEKQEIKWIVAGILIPSACILIGSAISLITPEGLSSLGHKGPHGLTEILFAFASAAENNGSSFGGLNANTTYYNIVLAVVMLIGRVSIIVPSLALAGMFAKKIITPPSVGTFSTNTILFYIMILAVILIEAGLTFFPALALGPIIEHFLMMNGQTF